MVLVESGRSLTNLAPPGLDSPMSGVSALMPIPPDSTRGLGLLLPDSLPFPLADIYPHVEEGGLSRTLSCVGTFIIEYVGEVMN